MPIGASRGAAGCQLGGTVGEHPYHRRAFGGDPVDSLVRPAMGKNGGSKASMGLGRGLFLQFVAVRAVCSKTGPDRSLCQLKRTARSDRFDQFMLFVQDRSRPVSVPSEMKCTVRSFRAVGAVCPISLFVSQAERERQKLERAREEQEAREAAEQADQLMRDRAEELERMKREQQRLQDELDALKKAKVCCHVAGLWFSFHGLTLRCKT